MTKKTKTARNKRIIAARRDGQSNATIAARENLTDVTISKICRDADVAYSRKHTSQETKDAVVRARPNAQTLDDLAKQFNISRSAISGHFSRSWMLFYSG